MKKTSSWLWGGVLVVLGIILGLNALGLAQINIFFPGWWTLFIIVPSVIGLFTEERKGGAMVGLTVGVCLLLSCLHVLPFGLLWKLLLPFILVVVGLTVMVRGTARGEVMDRIREAEREQGRHSHKRHQHIAEAEIVEDDTKAKRDSDDDRDGDVSDDERDDEDESDDEEAEPKYREYWSTFGSQEIDYNGKEFTGCKVDAVFGGADLDLRKAKIRDKAIVKTSSLFGGIIIYVPEDLHVEVASTSIFGGVSDKRKSKNNSSDKKSSNAKKTLFIEATCVFGGVEIR